MYFGASKGIFSHFNYNALSERTFVYLPFILFHFWNRALARLECHVTMLPLSMQWCALTALHMASKIDVRENAYMSEFNYSFMCACTNNGSGVFVWSIAPEVPMLKGNKSRCFATIQLTSLIY